MDISFLDEIQAAWNAHREKVRQAGNGVAHAEGRILFEGALLLLSARLQSHVEEIFISSVKIKFLHIKTQGQLDQYWKQMVGNWGNPNHDNINKLFLRVGIFNLLEDYRCPNKTEKETRENLDKFNQARNRIAHGKSITDIKGIGLTQGGIWQVATFVREFGQGLEAHVNHRIQ